MFRSTDLCAIVCLCLGCSDEPMQPTERPTVPEGARVYSSPLNRGRELVLYTRSIPSGAPWIRVWNASTNPGSRVRLVMRFHDGTTKDAEIGPHEVCETEKNARSTDVPVMQVTAIETAVDVGQVQWWRVHARHP